MASDTLPPDVRIPQTGPPEPPSPDELFIDDRLLRTRRQVKTVDLAAGILALAICVLVYLLAGAVADQWVVPGGLGFWSRLLFFAGLLAISSFWFVWRLLPLFLYRIDPVFAARTIEQARPSLKNGLINCVFLRRQRPQLIPTYLERRILEGLEHAAATELTAVPIETVVDRAPVIRLGYLLAAVLAVCAVYLVVSPKNPLVSFGRVLWPWAEIPAPTRVVFGDITPGDTTVFQGDMVTVSAEVTGLREGEEVTLYYTTADRQSVDQAIPMQVPKGEYRYQCELPPDRSGFQQDVVYYLQCGDAKTRRYQIRVQTALTILVDRVDYDYPAYTGIPDKSVERSGDLQGVEGTKVTIHATASQPIYRALIEMDGDPRQVMPMSWSGTEATGRLRLIMDPTNPTRPKHTSYQLRFSDGYPDQSGQPRMNRRPVRHRIEVIPDRPPEVRLVEPPPEEIQLPENGTLDLKVQAEDPDFGLRGVALRAERESKSLPIRPLLDRPAPQKAHLGPFEAIYRFQPATLGLKAGDRVIYFAEAWDNKEVEQGPAPNRAETQRRRILIVPPQQQGDQPKDQQGDQRGQQPEQGKRSSGQQSGQPSGESGKESDQTQPGKQQEGGTEPQAGKPQKGPQGGEPQQAEGSQQEAGKQQPGTKGAEQSGQQEQAGQEGDASTSQASGKRPTGSEESSAAQGKPDQAAGQKGQSQREPIDPESNPGDAFEEILAHRAEQQQQAKQPPSQQQAGEEASGSQPSEPTHKNDSPQAGAEKPATGQKPEQGQGAQAGESAQGVQQKPDEGGEKSQAKGGDPESGQQAGGREKEKTSEGKNEGSPSPQEANQPRKEKTSDQAASGQKQSESGKSPSISPKQSDSQSDTPGDRSGGGDEGGGQKSDQSGTGGAGSHTESDQGAGQSKQQGKGETGTKPGEQAQAKEPTGQSAPQSAGQGSGARKQPGTKQGGQPASKDQQSPPSGDQRPASQGTDRARDAEGKSETSQGAGGTGSGGQTGQAKASAQEPPPHEDSPADPVNRKFAEEAVNLSLEHLEDQLAKGKPDPKLLDRLGWTRDELEKFYQQWDAMRRAAGRRDPAGAAARSQWNKALGSLGLRPRSTQLRGGSGPADQLRDLRQTRRVAPPPAWAEQFRAYTEAVAEGKQGQ